MEIKEICLLIILQAYRNYVRQISNIESKFLIGYTEYHVLLVH